MDPAAGRAEQISASTAAVMTAKIDVTTKLDLRQSSETFEDKGEGMIQIPVSSRAACADTN
jgi:hypothetical protein